jgi:hypothetical protein
MRVDLEVAGWRVEGRPHVGSKVDLAVDLDVTSLRVDLDLEVACLKVDRWD